MQHSFQPVWVVPIVKVAFVVIAAAVAVIAAVVVVAKHIGRAQAATSMAKAPPAYPVAAVHSNLAHNTTTSKATL
jgi:hypothetical protein